MRPRVLNGVSETSPESSASSGFGSASSGDECRDDDESLMSWRKERLNTDRHQSQSREIA